MAFYRPIFWFGRRNSIFGGYSSPQSSTSNVQNTTNITAMATGGSTVSVNVNQSTVVNNSVSSGGYFPYYYPKRWW